MKRNLLLVLFTCCGLLAMAQRMTERLDRGVVAMNQGNNQLFVSWRYFATDPEDIAFNLYRQVGSDAPIKMNSQPITGATNYIWTIQGASLATASTILVKPVLKGIEGEVEGSWALPANAPNHRIVRDFDYAPLPAGYPAMQMKYCWVGDLNGDGRYDYVIDRHGSGLVDDQESDAVSTTTVSSLVEAYTSDGAFLWRIQMGPNVAISNGHNDMVTVYDMDGDGKAEVLLAVSEGTTFADGTQIKHADGTVHDYNTTAGSAPQWVAIVDGQTGRMLDRVNLPHFNDIATSRADKWKNIAGHFIIAYLDGIRPSLIYQYKNRQPSGHFTGAFAAWHYRDGRLVQDFAQRFHLTGAEYESHQVRAADVDGDGKDEFVEISYVIDDDGSLLSQAPGIDHGDRHCLTDIDPDRPGLEQFFIQQSNIIGMGLWDVASGEMIKSLYLSAVGDIGRGACAAIDPNVRGLQFFSTMNGNQLYDCQGNPIANAKGAFPAEFLWFGPDLSRWMVTPVGSGGYNIAFSRYNTSSKGLDRVLPNLYNEKEPYYLTAANGGRAAFWGDILGDWREEMVLARRDASGFAVVSTWEPTQHRQYCLMQNPAYRIQTTARGYYQTADVDFYMAADMPLPPVPPIQTADVILTDNSLPSSIDGKTLMIDIRNRHDSIFLDEDVRLSRLWLMNPKGSNHVLSGKGVLTGEGDVVKSMQGDVTLSGSHTYTGVTRVSEGRLWVNGQLQSPVRVDARGVVGGLGRLAGGIRFEQGLNRLGARLEPGYGSELGTLRICGDVVLPGRNNLAFDVDQTQSPRHDVLVIEGGLKLEGSHYSLCINALTPLQPDTLELVRFTQSTHLTADAFKLVGIDGFPYQLVVNDTCLSLILSDSRTPAKVLWEGSVNAMWDFRTPNFSLQGRADIFVPGDSVVFGDDAPQKSIRIDETMVVSHLHFENQTDYSLSGTGRLSGDASLTKVGTGKVSLLNAENNFTGGIDFADGTLVVASLKDGGLPSSIGASSSAAANWIMRNATLQTAGQLSTNRHLTIEGTLTIDNPANNSVMLSGNLSGKQAKLVLKGPGTLTLQGTNSFDSVFIKNGVLAIGSPQANSTAFGKAPIVMEGGTLQMRASNTTSLTGPWTNTIIVPKGKSARWNLPERWEFTNQLLGEGVLYLNTPYVRANLGGNWSAFKGTLVVSGRDLRINNSYGYGQSTIELSSGVSMYHVSSSGKTLRIGALKGVVGSKLTGDACTWVIGQKNLSTSFAGTIEGSSAKLQKEGSSSLTLSGANTYTGGTTVNGGQLVLSNTTGSATGSGVVVLRNGSQLSGTGSLTGGVSLLDSASIHLQDGALGSLSLGKSLSMSPKSVLYLDVNPHRKQSDQIELSGKAILDGRLVFKNLSVVNFKEGQQFKLIQTDGSIQGQFTSIEPALPDGLYWDQSRLSEGILQVSALSDLPSTEGKTILSVVYFDLSGRRLSWQDIQTDAPTVFVRQIRYSDGSLSTEKITR